MNDNMITFNVRNWITVFIMVLAGWAIVGLAVRLLRPGNRAASVPAGKVNTSSMAGSGYQNG